MLKIKLNNNRVLWYKNNTKETSLKKTLATVILFVLFFVPAEISQASFVRVPEFKAPGALVDFLSAKYNRPNWEILKIVHYAYHLGHPTQFPTPLDILAVIGVESSFKPLARGPGGQGLMQVNPSVWGRPDLDLNHPYENMVKGVEILSNYNLKTKNDVRALVYYNMGPGGGSKACEELGTCKTEYVLKVIRLKKQLARFAGKELLCLLY